ncbi:hypothetical protein F4779DRAFT_570101 [Xylariaceae sp. FL0662B]|nr:hypothetical protein F4779DRAFT_570101 [Xylariaceae sp. FL0662B]
MQNVELSPWRYRQLRSGFDDLRILSPLFASRFPCPSSVGSLRSWDSGTATRLSPASLFNLVPRLSAKRRFGHPNMGREQHSSRGTPGVVFRTTRHVLTPTRNMSYQVLFSGSQALSLPGHQVLSNPTMLCALHRILKAATCRLPLPCRYKPQRTYSYTYRYGLHTSRSRSAISIPSPPSPFFPLAPILPFIAYRTSCVGQFGFQVRLLHPSVW